MLPKRVLLLCLLLLTACNQSGNTPKDNSNVTTLKTVADSYSVTQGALTLVGKDQGVLKNDTIPTIFTLRVNTEPQHGTLELKSDGSFSYQHNDSGTTIDSFTYTVSTSGKTSTAQVSLGIMAKSPKAPTANADAYALDEGTTLIIDTAEGLLKNDFNPLGSSLTTSVVQTPEHGTLTLNTDGSFTYIHDHSETTADSFIYSLDNGQETANANVVLTISPVDDTPMISKLELAQTHIIPAEGKSWDGDKLSEYNLHLVGNRAALVLVDISSANNRIVDAVIEAYIGEQKLGEVILNMPESLPTTESDGPAYSQTAYWAILDKTWIKPGLELRIRANEGQVSEFSPVNVGASSEFIMYSLPFYLFGLDENDIPLTQTAAPDQATKDEYFAKHPFANLNMINHPAKKVQWPYIIVGPRDGRVAQKVNYKEQQGDGFAVMSAVLNTLGAIRNANGDSPTNNQYYGPLLMANKAGNYSGPGGGLGGGHLGTGDHSYTGIFIHEAGHAFGMPHANDGYTSGTYPYIGGSLKGSNWGFDQIHNEFLGTFVPSNASRYAGCATDGFVVGRQFDALGRCIKQDPMQSGAGDQAEGYKYTMFSDFNAAIVQHYIEGSTELKSDGTRNYNGGRVFIDPTSASGYSRWDSLDSTLVPVTPSTSSGGLYGLDNGFPTQRNVPVHTIILTLSLESIQDTFTEVSGETHLSYQDTITYNTNLTQIYPPLSYIGNLRRVIDPKDAAQLASIVPDTSENYWYCRNSGCDYTLKATYTDNSEYFVVLHGGFRSWFSKELKSTAGNPNSGDSYKVFGVNVPGNKTIKKIELLETPEIWKGLPALPKVIASRLIN